MDPKKARELYKNLSEEQKNQVNMINNAMKKIEKNRKYYY